jgi:hypothetical protein
MAEATPPCAVDEIAVVPERVHPVNAFSKSPFVMPPGGGAVTVKLTEALWVALAAVPVIVTV